MEKLLILTQWAPWSWKSTWCHKNNLEEYCFNLDRYRISISWYKKDKDWNEVIDNSDNKKIWSFINQELQERLKRWLLTVVDSTLTNLMNLQWYYILAKKYWYTLAIKTFNVWLDELLIRNENRNQKQKVQEHIIRKMHLWLEEILNSNFFQLDWVIQFNELSDLWITKKKLEKIEKINFNEMINKYNFIYWFKDEEEIDNIFLKRYPLWRKFELFEEYQNAIIVNKLKRDPLINISLISKNIASFSFKRDAFTNKIWNSETIRSRWLFVNLEKNEVVARSYNKFFNLWEHEESTFEYIQEHFKWKISIFKKENWFLWIIWYNQEEKEVLYCSKSTNIWPFADLVKKHCEKYEKKMLPMLKKWYSFVFEIVDTENDPHIIDYEKNNEWAYLLDIFENKFEQKMLSYDELVKIWKKIWCKTKIKYEELSSIKKLTKEKIEELSNLNYEWFVINDEEWHHVKLKSKFYLFWKSIRKIVRIMKKSHQKNKIWLKENKELFEYCYSILTLDFDIFNLKYNFTKRKFKTIYNKISSLIEEWNTIVDNVNILKLRNYITSQ